MAMTTSSSIKVKPRRTERIDLSLPEKCHKTPYRPCAGGDSGSSKQGGIFAADCEECTAIAKKVRRETHVFIEWT
jgi:hypothetical protein